MNPINPGPPPPATDISTVGLCGCHSCRTDRKDTVGGLPYSMAMMVLCPRCGNKRCPHANNHKNDCTHSNATGQPGSAYP